MSDSKPFNRDCDFNCYSIQQPNLHAECNVLVRWNCDQALLRDAGTDLVRLNDLECSSYFYLLIMYIQQVHEQWNMQDSKGAWGG